MSFPAKKDANCLHLFQKIIPNKPVQVNQIAKKIINDAMRFAIDRRSRNQIHEIKGLLTVGSEANTCEWNVVKVA